MKAKYRALSLALALVLCLGLLPAASAAQTDCRCSVIAGGLSHSLAVQENGSVWGWGGNSDKQAVPSSNAQSITVPTKIAGLAPAVSVAAGSNFSAALLRDGTVAVWGGGSGLSSVPGLAGVSSISAGQSTLLALKQDGTVWQWFFGDPAPEQIKGLANIAAVSAGGGHYLALTRSGKVWAWGSNSYGQLGTGSSGGRIDTPKLVSGLSDIISIAAGFSHSLAVDFNGQVYAWGSNSSGQLGTGNTNNSARPKSVQTVKKAVQVSAGNDSSMVLTSDNRVYTWGYGEYGQLGTFSTANACTQPSTVSMASIGAPLMIASGMTHNLLLNSRGVIYTWGRNRDAQLGNGENTNGTTPRSISLSLSTTGSCTVNTYNTNLQTGMSGWAAGELTTLYGTGLVPPSMWERYGENITRAEFAHMVAAVYEQVRGRPDSPAARAGFKDIKGHPLEQSILRAYEYKLLKGRSDTVFDPDVNITRQEAATLLCTLVNRLSGVQISTKPGSLSCYSDADQIAAWASPYVAFAYEQGIMGGSDGKFNPAGFTTREQALAIIARLEKAYGWA